ncbi:hypothetical protein GCK32_008949, partial [Trichostrongylus colubriformis]
MAAAGGWFLFLKAVLFHNICAFAEKNSCTTPLSSRMSTIVHNPEEYALKCGVFENPRKEVYAICFCDTDDCNSV